MWVHLLWAGSILSLNTTRTTHWRKKSIIYSKDRVPCMFHHHTYSPLPLTSLQAFFYACLTLYYHHKNHALTKEIILACYLLHRPIIPEVPRKFHYHTYPPLPLIFPVAALWYLPNYPHIHVYTHSEDASSWVFDTLSLPWVPPIS